MSLMVATVGHILSKLTQFFVFLGEYIT